MWVSDEYILLENPRCGVASLARYLNLTRVDGSPKHATTKEARSLVGKDVWSKRTKIITVRDPVERLVSALRFAARESGASVVPDDNTLVRDALASGDLKANRMLLPQTVWLSAKFDIVLPLPSFASFANSRQVSRDLNPHNDYPQRAVNLTDELREEVRAHYAADYLLFARLPVWPSAPGNVVLLAGACKRCSVRKTYGISS